MRAARLFTQKLSTERQLGRTTRVKSELFGSLAATGIGHGTDAAVVLGLAGCDPETLDAEAAPGQVEAAVAPQRLQLGGHHGVDFHREEDVVLRFKDALPEHPNGMRFTAYDE